MPIYYAGIDVAKYKHTCCVADSNGEVVVRSFDFANSAEGYALLLKTLDALGPRGSVKVGMESTGHYHENLCRRLLAEGYPVRAQNPKTIVSFRKSRNVSKAKTDGNDALEIALYFATFGFTPSTGKSYTHEALYGLAKDANALIAERSALYNRIQRHLDVTFPELLGFLRENADGSRRNSTRGRNVLGSPTTRWILSNFPSARAVSSMTDADYATLRRLSHSAFSPIRFARMKALAASSVGTPVGNDEAMVRSLAAQCGLIDSQLASIESGMEGLLASEPHEFAKIKGIGPGYASAILGCVGDFSRFPTADALLKYSGMVPSLYQSGTVERRGRMEKKGPWLLRYALVQAAQKVVLHYPKWAEYYRRKCSEGKFYKVALAHVAAKLLKAIWLIETRGLEFDESRF